MTYNQQPPRAFGTAQPTTTSTPRGGPIRVLVVDDSVLMRQSVRRILDADPEITVVDVANDGLDALAKTERHQPDVVTMDVEMPRLDGLQALQKLMERFPRPVVMFSSLTDEGTTATIKALSLGAVDFLCKPSGQSTGGMASIAEELTSKVKRAARARVRKILPPARPVVHTMSAPTAKPPTNGISTSILGPEPEKILIIGSSTGGPRALSEVVPALPGDIGCPVIIVQHLPAGFTKSLADRLNSTSALTISEAKDGDLLQNNHVLIAPGNFHLTITGRRIVLEDGPRRHGVRPSVDFTLESAAATFGPATLGVILTGMGEDGAEGCKVVKAAAGVVLAEAESTCVVYGMPRAVIEAGCADEIVPLDKIAPAIIRRLTMLRPRASSRRVAHAG